MEESWLKVHIPNPLPRNFDGLYYLDLLEVIKNDSNMDENIKKRRFCEMIKCEHICMSFMNHVKSVMSNYIQKIENISPSIESIGNEETHHIMYYNENQANMEQSVHFIEERNWNVKYYMSHEGRFYLCWLPPWEGNRSCQCLSKAKHEITHIVKMQNITETVSVKYYRSLIKHASSIEKICSTL